MILSKLTKFAWAFFVLALTAGTLSAQRGNSRNAAVNGQSNNCLNQISGLSTEQADIIRELNNEHNLEMAQLRADRRSKTDTKNKDQIRTEMLNRTDNHRSQIRSLLNTKQQQEFDAYQRYGNSNTNQGNRLFQRENNKAGFQQNLIRNFNGSGRGKNGSN